MRTGGSRTRSSPEGQGVTFVELFFDLVFVFAVTEVTGLLHHDLSLGGVLRFVVVFWLVWWGWTQFTWALNAADTTHHGIQAATLASVLIAFAMAMGVGRAYDGSGLWFALPYVALRAVGLGVYLWVAVEDPLRRAAVWGFTTASTFGLVAAVVGGVVPESARPWVWALAIVLDMGAALVGANSEGWDLRHEHFAERHGLFVIIALGESLIAAGVPAATADRSAELVVTAGLAVAVASLMWWTYFAHAKPTLEAALATRSGIEQSALARDAYSLLHFPLLCGIVAVAVALEESVAHPSEALPGNVTASFAVGIALYLVGVSVVHRRAEGGWLAHRLAVAAVVAVLTAAFHDVSPIAVLGAGLVGLLAVAVYEELAFDTMPVDP